MQAQLYEYMRQQLMQVKLSEYIRQQDASTIKRIYETTVDASKT